ncbi:MAG: AEC family transporter [Proteobacteria bacterium]|nr:AEC family transporter [Pseudomonadota bacterium]
MDSTVAVVLPMFGLMLSRYLTAKTDLLGGEAIKGLSNFVFYFAIPALLFRGMATGTMPEQGDLHIVYAYYLGILIVYAASLLIARLVFRTSLPEQALMALTATFGNNVMLGIPVIHSTFGDVGVLPVTLIVTFHSTVMIVITTVFIEFGRGQTHAGRVARTALMSLLQNPVILAIAAGFVWTLVGMPMPVPLDAFTQLLAGAAAPCALFALGATLRSFHVGGDQVEVAAVITIKLLVVPVVVWATTRFYTLTPLQIAVAVILAGLPSGANPFILAQRYGIYVARSASAVLISTALSILTTALLIAHYAPAR